MEFFSRITKKQLFILIAIIAIVAGVFIIASVTDSYLASKRLDKFENSELAIDKPGEFKPFAVGGRVVLSASQPSTEKQESISISKKSGDDKQATVEKTRAAATIDYYTDQTIPTSSVRDRKIGGKAALDIIYEDEAEGYKFRSVYIFDDKNTWLLKFSYLDGSDFAKSMDKIINSFEVK